MLYQNINNYLQKHLRSLNEYTELATPWQHKYRYILSKKLSDECDHVMIISNKFVATNNEFLCFKVSIQVLICYP